MTILRRICCVVLLSLPIIIANTSYAAQRFAPVVVDSRCGAGAEIDFKGLAYFCYRDQAGVTQLYRSNGLETNWQAMTDFVAGSTDGLQVVFKTETSLYFTALRNGQWRLYRTKGTPGDHRDLGARFDDGRSLRLVASDGDFHYLRMNHSLFVLNERIPNVQFIATTTRDGGLYRSDVAYLNGYLYYVNSNSFGYWNLLERVDRNGKRELLEEFPATTDTFIEPIVTSNGFIFYNDGNNNPFFVDANGSVKEKNGSDTLIAKVGDVFILLSGEGQLIATERFSSYTPLGAGNGGGLTGASQFIEIGTSVIIHLGNDKYIVTDGSAGGTSVVSGTPLFESFRKNIGMLIQRGDSDLYYLNPGKLTQPSLIAQFKNTINSAYARDRSSYYAFTEDDIFGPIQLWRVYIDGREPVLLRSFNERITFAKLEAQRLYFGVYGSNTHLWHSNGTPESTYRLLNSAIELPSLGWIPAIHDLIQDERRQ